MVHLCLSFWPHPTDAGHHGMGCVRVLCRLASSSRCWFLKNGALVLEFLASSSRCWSPRNG
eukprot:1144549-Pelagomonas_calceolata.AAC.4